MDINKKNPLDFSFLRAFPHFKLCRGNFSFLPIDHKGGNYFFLFSRQKEKKKEKRNLQAAIRSIRFQSLNSLARFFYSKFCPAQFVVALSLNEFLFSLLCDYFVQIRRQPTTAAIQKNQLPKTKNRLHFDKSYGSFSGDTRTLAALLYRIAWDETINVRSFWWR